MASKVSIHYQSTHGINVSALQQSCPVVTKAMINIRNTLNDDGCRKKTIPFVNDNNVSLHFVKVAFRLFWLNTAKDSQ